MARATIDGPTKTLFVSREVREAAAGLDENDATNWITEMGLPYMHPFHQTLYIDHKWLRNPGLVFETNLKEFAVDVGYGDRLLSWLNEHNERTGWFETELGQQVCQTMEAWRLPADECADYFVGCVVLKKRTNERLRIVELRRPSDLIWPWNKDADQTMKGAHIDAEGNGENKSAGWVSNSEVRTCSDLSLQPNDPQFHHLLLRRMAESLQSVEAASEQSFRIQMEKLGGQISLTLRDSNVRRMREVTQVIGCSTMEFQLLPLVYEQGVEVTWSQNGRQVEFEICDDSHLNVLIPEDLLTKQTEDEKSAWSVLCSTENPVTFSYNFGTHSQVFRVRFEVGKVDIQAAVGFVV